MRCLGIDPSGDSNGSTGLVMINEDEVEYVKTIKGIDFETVEEYYMEIQNTLENLTTFYFDVNIAVEDYIVDTSNPANRNRSVPTLKLIGWLMNWAYKKKIKLHLQPNRLIKVGMTNEFEGKYGIRRLKEMGYIKMRDTEMYLGASKQTFSVQHERDALRHAIVLKRELEKWEKNELKS